MESKIPDKGPKTVTEIMDHLTYSSYRANRGYGVSHERLLKIGIGNKQMKQRYLLERLSAVDKKTLIGSIIHECINTHSDPNELIRVLRSQSEDNPTAMQKVLGDDLYTLIWE
jgi:hypothetical protein